MTDRQGGRAIQAERLFAAGVMAASWLAASRANRSARNFAVRSRMACLSARYSAIACWPSRNRSSFFCKAVAPRSEVSEELVLNVVTPFCRGTGDARRSLVYLGQIVEALIMRHDALQGPVTSISVGLSAMEARHGPSGNGTVVDERDDDNAPGVLAIRAGAKLGDNQPLDIVLGLRKFFHNRTTNQLGLPDRSPPVRHMWGDRRKTSMADRDSDRGDNGRRRLLKMRGGPKRPMGDPGSPGRRRAPRPPRKWFGLCRSQPTGGSCVGNDGEMRLSTALTKAPNRVGPHKKQTASCAGLHKMCNWNGRSAQHRRPGGGTGADRVRVPELRVRDERPHSSRWRPITQLFETGRRRSRPVSPSSSTPRLSRLGR